MITKPPPMPAAPPLAFIFVSAFISAISDTLPMASSTSPLERDVFRNEFLKTRGWQIYRVWSRDWWHNSAMVITNIVRLIEKQKKLLTLDKSVKKARAS